MELCLVEPRRDFFDKKMDEERTSYLSKAKHSEFTSIILIKKKGNTLINRRKTFICLFIYIILSVPFSQLFPSGRYCIREQEEGASCFSEQAGVLLLAEVTRLTSN